MLDSQVNSSICPLCSNENKCQVEASKPCWCFNVNVPQELLKKLPLESQNKACICRRCLDEFNDKKNAK